MQRTDPVEKKSISLPMVSGTSMDTELDTRSYGGSADLQTIPRGNETGHSEIVRLYGDTLWALELDARRGHAPSPQRCPIVVPRVSPVLRAC
jgi:hypothetical protein